MVWVLTHAWELSRDEKVRCPWHREQTDLVCLFVCVPAQERLLADMSGQQARADSKGSFIQSSSASLYAIFNKGV